MPQNLTQKILAAHLVEGRLNPGEEIGLRIDHTLLQDATGTMAMLEFEALGFVQVKADALPCNLTAEGGDQGRRPQRHLNFVRQTLQSQR